MGNGRGFFLPHGRALRAMYPRICKVRYRTANILRNKRCSMPTAVPLISQRSPVSGLRQAKKQRETGVKRVETAGVYPLAHAAGRGDVPAVHRRRNPPLDFKRKTSRPLGANTPAAVRVPRSAGAEKTACAVRISSLALCRENEKGTAHAVPLPSADMSAAQQQQLPQLPQPPQVLSPQVPQEPQPPLP